MKTSVLETSCEAYHSDKMHAASKKERVEQYARNTKRFTAVMAADALGVATATMSGIINPMIKAGTLKREIEKHPCHTTGNNAFWLYHKDYIIQQSLFN